MNIAIQTKRIVSNCTTMKISTSLALIATTALSLLTGKPAAAAPEVVVYGNATYTDESVLLDVFADVTGGQLRSFGISVNFAPEKLETTSVVRYAGLWYLAKEDGTHLPYAEPRIDEANGRIWMIGGHLDGRRPSSGMEGRRLLLGTFAFNRLNAQDGSPPEFQIGLASQEPFANFTEAGAGPVDSEVQFTGQGLVMSEPAPEDRDEDGLPDSYELQMFNSTSISDGSSDSDCDGVSDYDEWLGGTDPTDPNSRMTLTVSVGPNGGKLLEWTSMEGRAYALQWSTGLSGFENLIEGIPGNDGTDSLSLPETEGRAFYRIVMTNPTVGR